MDSFEKELEKKENKGLLHVAFLLVLVLMAMYCYFGFKENESCDEQTEKIERVDFFKKSFASPLIGN